MYNPRHKEIVNLIEGAYDLHTHTSPDLYPRELNDITLLQEADQYKMKGVMLKNHFDPTPARAELLNQSGRFKAKAYGSAVLNYTVGGLNIMAVETYLKLGAKIIWMPTVHARNQIEYKRLDPISGKRPGIRLLDEDGNIKEDVLEILSLIKQYDATVATGHISIGESIAVCVAAREMGIKTVLTHPDWGCTTIPIEIQKYLIEKGVIAEKLWFDVGINHVTTAYIAQTIRDLGVSNCYISTDRGQPGKELPPIGLQMFMDALMDEGFCDDEIRILTHAIPEKVIS